MLAVSNIGPFFNSTIALTATVGMVTANTPIPTGSVSFYATPASWMGGTTELIGTVDLATGGATAICNVAREFGDWSFYAHYNGDARWAESQSWPMGVVWFGNLQFDFATALASTNFGNGGYLGGTWGTVVIGNIGFSYLPWGPEWFAEAYAWGNIYAPAHYQASLLCASTGPTVWELFLEEGQGSFQRWAVYALTSNSPSGTYSMIESGSSGGMEDLPSSFAVDAAIQ